LPMVTGLSASSVAANIGKVAFLAPEMRTSPSSRVPPDMISLSTQRALRSAGVSVVRESAWMSVPMRGPSAE
jgi:hypothetical protein